MLQNGSGRIVIVLMVIAVVIITGAAMLSKSGGAVAQAPNPPAPGEPVGPPMGPHPGMMMGGMPPIPAVTASGEYVYVVQGNTLSQFNAKTLALVKQVPIPMPRPPMPPQGQ